MIVLIKICAVSMVFLFLSLLLKNNANEFVFFMRIAVIVIVFFTIAEPLSEFVSSVIYMFSSIQIDSLHIKSLIKVAGIAIVSDFICDILKDNNENALSRVVEISAKLLILIISFPMMNSLVAFCIEIVN